MTIEQTIEAIKAHHRRRRYAMRMQQQLERPLEAYVRINMTDWEPSDDEGERGAAVKEAQKILKDAKAGIGEEELIQLVATVKKSKAPWDEIRSQEEKELETIAESLPVAEWVKGIPGAGLLGLATIVGETGDLGNYANPAKVWKRLGFAPYDGHAGSSWKRETWRPRSLTKEEWIDNPFSGKRYALMHVIAVWLKNKQWIGAAKTEDGVGKPNGHYGEVYAARRSRTAETHPDWSKQHAHMDALRIMMKEFLKDLWIEWRRAASRRVESRSAVLHDAEPSARDGVKSSPDLPKARSSQNGGQASYETPKRFATIKRRTSLPMNPSVALSVATSSKPSTSLALKPMSAVSKAKRRARTPVKPIATAPVASFSRQSWPTSSS